MDQLYDASIYFQLDDLKELIMNSLLNFDKSKLQDEQTLLNICKSLDFLLMEALFLDQDLKKCLNWFYDEIQVLSDSLLHMILKSSSNNIFESLLTLPFKTKEADRKFLIFFDSFKEKDEKDQNYLKSFLMEGFDAYQDQLKEYFSQCNITNRISSISNSENDEHDQSMFYSNSFTFQSDQEILCQFKFNFDQILFRTALRQSNHKIGGYVTLDVDKLKELKKIPEFTITVMGQSLKILTSIAIKRNTDFQQWITERVGIHEYGVDELLTSIDLKVGKRYVYAVIFHGLVDFE
ncbi:hypothetical protein HDV02_005840 [Globomyces sp. JEL0801]|nr:hypothetical protein HDV02_005840 [Globomyces sp. JEL0801]